MKFRAEKVTMVEDIEQENVMSVYSGKADSCRCGCSGKYYYSSNMVGEASEHRGYEVRADEVNDGMVKRVVAWMNAHKDETEVIFDRDTVIINAYFSPVREYTIYARVNVEVI